MNTNDFRKHAHEMVDWIADYMETLEDRPVRAQVKPGDIKNALPASPPMNGEPFADMMQDVENIIMPGITHWQHPRFYAYFPANVTPPSILAEMLTSAMGVNAMIWETSPAATELEEQMMTWLKEMMALPSNWSGVIQDTASSAVFCAALVAREKATNWQVNETGFAEAHKLTVYTSRETHSSLEKAVKMAGMGKQNIRYVPVDHNHSMDADALAKLIAEDKENGYTPALIVASMGATGVGACDPLREIGAIAKQHDVFYHVDGAWAGSAMVCEEYRHLADGLDTADSYAFNPHKWMGVNFDCCAHFVRDKHSLIQTLTILPEYLKTREGDTVTDYRDWGVQLGRRNRALKLWFVIRTYGVEGLKDMFRRHIALAEQLANIISNSKQFELVTKPMLSLFSFRFVGEGLSDKEADRETEELLTRVNDDGYTYLTRTLVDGRPVIRWQIGQVNSEEVDVINAWNRVVDLAK